MPDVNPSCLHATVASPSPKFLSHIVPHRLSLCISKRPALVSPPTSLRSPFVGTEKNVGEAPPLRHYFILKNLRIQQAQWSIIMQLLN